MLWRTAEPRLHTNISLVGQVDSIRAYFLPSVRLSLDLSSWTSPDLEQEQQWMRQQMRQTDSDSSASHRHHSNRDKDCLYVNRVTVEVDNRYGV